jgi:hypothetical protein
MAVNPQKLLPPPSSAIVKVGKIKINKPQENKTQKNNISTALLNELEKIKENLEKIYGLVLDNNKLIGKDLEVKRKSAERLRFDEKEERLETEKPKKEEKEDKDKTAPKLSIFDRINRFITFTLLGWVAVRLVKHIPKLLEFTKKIGPVMEFFSTLTTNIFTGLIDFIDWGYKAHDNFRGFIGELGGEPFQKAFDDFSSNLNKFVNLAIIAGIAASGGTDFGLGKKGPKPGTQKPGARPRPGQGGRPRVTASGGGRAGIPNIRNPLRGRPNVTSSGGGRAGAPNIRNPLRQRPKITGGGRAFGRIGAKLGGKVLGRIPIIGGLVDFLFALWSGEPVGRAAAKGVGSTIGAALGTFIPIPFAGTILGGILGDIVGGALYDTLVDKKPEKPEVVAKRRGGKVSGSKKRKTTTRKGKVVGGAVRRRVRRITQPPKATPINPGRSTGGKERFKEMFPEPEEKGIMNPYGHMTETSKVMTDVDFMGPIFNLFAKVHSGDLPTQIDYKRVGASVSAWVNQAISATGSNSSGYSNGGVINNMGIGDIDKWIEKSAQQLFENKAYQAISDLRKNLGLEPYVDDYDYDDGGGGGDGDSFDGKFDGSGMEMAKQIYSKLISDGIPSPAAAGIVGNIGAESDFDPAIIERDTGIGRGWLQWSYTRRTAFENWAQRNRIDPDTAEANYRYMLYEMRGNDGNHWIPRSDTPRNLQVRSLREYIEKSSDPDTAAKLFMYNYERPRADVQHLDKRIKYAREIFGGSSSTGSSSTRSSRRGRNRSTGSTERPTESTTYDQPTTRSSGYRPSNPGRFSAIEYITGDRTFNPSHYDLGGHGTPVNYHDHIAFKTIADKENAKKALRDAGIRIGSELRRGDPGYHGLNLAIDIPGGQWGGSGAIGEKEFEGSRRVREILGLDGGSGDFQSSEDSGRKSRSGSSNFWGISGFSGWGISGFSGWGIDGGKKRRRRRNGSSQDSSDDLSNLSGKDKKIYLHWNVAGYDNPVGPYHAVFLGDGRKVQNHPYDKTTPHTHRRNNNAIGLAVAAMGGTTDTYKWVNPPTITQLNAMANEVANIAKSMNWTKSDINKTNVMTHAEAAFLDGYGYGSGDSRTKWDMITLKQSDMNSQNTKSPGSKGGNDMRNMIKQKMKDGGIVGENAQKLQFRAPYEDGTSSAILIQPIIIEKPIPMSTQNGTIAFIGGGVNSTDTSKSAIFMG